MRSTRWLLPLCSLAYPGCSFSAPIGLTKLTGLSRPLLAAAMNSTSSRRCARPGVLGELVRAVRVHRGRIVLRVGAGTRGGAVGPAGAADVAGRVVPAAAVPGPVHALGGEPVADGRCGLRR